MKTIIYQYYPLPIAYHFLKIVLGRCFLNCLQNVAKHPQLYEVCTTRARGGVLATMFAILDGSGNAVAVTQFYQAFYLFRSDIAP